MRFCLRPIVAYAHQYDQGALSALGFASYPRRAPEAARDHGDGGPDSRSRTTILEIISAATDLQGGSNSRIRVSGPDFHLKARPALALSLVLHELLTNAFKYGSLSNETGSVAISWSETGVGADAQFNFAWEETGGPVVRPPERRGFGTRLIEAGVSTDLGAGAAIDYRPEGVRWTIRARLDTLKE